MKKFFKLTAVLTVIALLTSCFAVFHVSAAAPTPTTEGDYAVYTVSTATELNDTVTAVNELADTSKIMIKLNADISLNTLAEGETWATKTNATSWTGLGSTTKPFNGIFDGNGYKISGLYVNATSDYQGLISYTNKNGCTVKKLTIDNSYIKSTRFVGAVIGCIGDKAISAVDNTSGPTMLSNVVVTNTYVEATAADKVNGAGSCAGGLVGAVYAPLNIQNAFLNLTVKGNLDTGGLIGWAKMTTVTVTNVVTCGTVDGTPQKHTGGFIGAAHTAKVTLTNCINANANALSLLGSTNDQSGLFIGYGWNAAGCSATNCYFEGTTNTNLFGTGGVGGTTTDATVTAKSRDELAAIVKAMGEATENKYTLATKALGGLFGNDMVYAQIRSSDNALRFVAPITGKDYKAVGMTIKATYNENDKSVTETATTLYKTITETVDGKTTHTTAVENEYFYCFVLTDIPQDADVTFEVTSFVTVDDGSADGITYTTGTYTATYNAGNLK